jgi:branched-chain amino acid transport system permease protein
MNLPKQRPLMYFLRQRLLLYAIPIIILLLVLVAPSFVGKANVSLLMKILVYGLLAMGLDLAQGYAGLWSLGHAGIMGVAAYTVCLLMRHFDIYNFWLLAGSGIVAATIFGAIMAALGGRMRRLYFMLVTYALGEVISAMARTFRPITNGSDGLWPMKYPDLGFGFTLSHTGLFYFILVIVIVCGFVLYRITKSPFGHSLLSLQENEVRTRTLGYNVDVRRFIAMVISSFFTGIAGVLWVYAIGGISPPDAGINISGLLMILVILGGSGTIWGGLVGSAVMITLNYFISIFVPDRWPLFLGILFIVVIFFSRKGLYLRIVNMWKKVIGYGNTEG